MPSSNRNAQADALIDTGKQGRAAKATVCLRSAQARFDDGYKPNYRSARRLTFVAINIKP